MRRERFCRTLLYGAGAEGAKKTIGTILEMKIGAQAATLFLFLDTITDLDALNRITRQLLTANTPEGASAIFDRFDHL